MGARMKMIGTRCGMLTVKERLPNSKLLCLCDCGNTRSVYIGHFNTGYYKSCGCHAGRHGHASNGARSREYICYYNMKKRCLDPKNSRFSDYGGRGITVCERWNDSFLDFLDDMGRCPSGMTIDRINNEHGYSPENCRWVSRKENQRNRACSLLWVVNGVEYDAAIDAAKAHGVSQRTIGAWCNGRMAQGRWYPPKDRCSCHPKNKGDA